MQKLNSISHFFYTILHLKNCVIWLAESTDLNTTIYNRGIFKNFDKGLCIAKNQGNPSGPFWDIALLRTLQFGWLSGHAWPRLQKTVASTCRKLWKLSVLKKWASSHTSLWYYTSTNSAIWLTKSISLQVEGLNTSKNSRQYILSLLRCCPRILQFD